MSHPRRQVLILEETRDAGLHVAGILESAGYAPTIVDDPQSAGSELKKHQFSLVFCEHRIGAYDGIEFIRSHRASFPETAFVLTAHSADVNLAAQAIRAGAYDYLQKPISPEALALFLRKMEERKKMYSIPDPVSAATSDRRVLGGIVARSQAMIAVFDTIQRLAQFSTTVLISGESGTGKELVARAIHDNSTRKAKPFVAINCGAIPEHLMESELFGHKKGAFTDATRDKRGLFEEAQDGTLFLDEIGELPLHLQVKLLRALQEQQIRRVGDELPITINARIISATLRNLDADVTEGRFREDLFYRLNVVSIPLLPLRERPEDLPVLIEHFLQKHSARLGMPIKPLAPDTLKTLLSYRWPGNARELENCIERLLVLSPGETLSVDALPDAITQGSKPNADPGLSEDLDSNLSIKQRTRDLEIHLIRRALKKTKGNRTHAAKILELSHRALLYKLKDYEIE
jgi:two-component system response regulator AtoC